MSFGERLRAERSRLALKQDDLALVAGASKRQLIAWEKDEAMPNASYLTALSAAGIDVAYLLTGIQLSVEDRERFRAASRVTLQVEGRLVELEHLARLNLDAMTAHAYATGTAPPTPLSVRERALLDNYRSASDEGRKALEQTGAAVGGGTKADKSKEGDDR